MRIPTLSSPAAVAAAGLITVVVAGTAWTYGSSPSRARVAVPPCSPQVDILAVINRDPDASHINAEIDSTFPALVARANSRSPSSRYDRITLLGKILLFDKNLSVDRNLACETCHMQEAGFTGASEILNRTIVAYPGSAGGLVSARKPQSYGYAAFAPILHYNSTQKNFYGGNFWDMRATGIRLDNPTAEQAQGPPLNPLEMALPDAACAVFRMSRGPYRAYFERVWGAQSFAIHWPAGVEQVCSRPAPAPANDTLPVHLSAIDRGIASATFDAMALSMASYEASPEVSPFTSKLDSALAHADQQILSADELAGWALFRGKANCNTCHLDGTANRGGARRSAGADNFSPSDAADVAPLFTDFTPVNVGVPRNRDLRFYCENKPNAAGYAPNAAGLDVVDRGVGDFLRSKNNPSSAWAALAPRFDGAMRVPTLRNVDKRPRPGFVKAYMHNGYFKSLEEVVHFYNTRDVLPRCQGDNPAGEKVSCWPAPEVAANVDTTVGKLGLTAREEAQIVAFLKTLTDAPARTSSAAPKR
ncbi:MAG: putative methylamine utilization protein MauG [Gemmatimonadetes bacterium]|nr:putative methylamine utilization protein MauG [Gemmatimonadota bacterium]